jgi:hypothetical protein
VVKFPLKKAEEEGEKKVEKVKMVAKVRKGEKGRKEGMAMRMSVRVIRVLVWDRFVIKGTRKMGRARSERMGVGVEMGSWVERTHRRV